MDKTRNHQRFAVTAHSSYACHGLLAVLLFLPPFAPNAVTSDEPDGSAASAESSESPPSPELASPESPPVVESNLLKVSTRPNLAFEGGAVRTTIRVGRDSRNRVLRLSVDGERFGAISEFWLDGVDAAIVHERIWPTLPRERSRGAGG